VLQDFDVRFKTRLQDTIASLEKEEKRFAQDAYELIAKMQAAANAIAVNTQQNARVALYQADIFAYAAQQRLSCQQQVSRVVYASSANTTTPLTLDLNVDQPQLVIEGNWLNLGLKTVTLNGNPCSTQTDPTTGCKISSVGEKEVLLEFPPGPPSMPQGGGRTAFVPVSIKPIVCTPGRTFGDSRSQEADYTSAFNMQVVPVQEYEVSTSISPTAVMHSDPYWGFGGSRYHEAGCNDHNPIADPFYLPDGYVLEPTSPAAVSVSTANCDSGVTGLQEINPQQVEVFGHVGGCGSDIWGCKGGGSLGFSAVLHVIRLSNQALALFSEEDQARPHSRVIVRYPPDNIPSDATNLDCHYDVRIVDADGNAQEATDDDTGPLPSGITVTSDASNCNVTITFP
jgi:hypothetical protein